MHLGAEFLRKLNNEWSDFVGIYCNRRRIGSLRSSNLSLLTLSELFDPPTETSGAPLLSFRDVDVQFGGLKALDKVTFDVMAHEVVAVIGPNGAGKSTMLNSISGLTHGRVSGDISISGRSVLGKAAVKIARTGVGRSFQNPPLIETNSVLENVMLGEHQRLEYGMASQIWRRRRVRRFEEEGRRRALTILDFIGLTDYSDQAVASLSYGTRKLIDIARAVVAGPQLLLLDEPTSGLDTQEQSTVSRILIELHEATPITMLVVEHHMNVVRGVSDHVVGLESGSVVAFGAAEEVLNSEAFRILESPTP
jgi:branched-chain amino acid transport system ATP-binding protein